MNKIHGNKSGVLGSGDCWLCFFLRFGLARLAAGWLVSLRVQTGLVWVGMVQLKLALTD